MSSERLLRAEFKVYLGKLKECNYQYPEDTEAKLIRFKERFVEIQDFEHAAAARDLRTFISNPLENKAAIDNILSNVLNS